MSLFTSSAARASDWRHLRCTVADGVATVTLARPEKLNALTFGAYADLRDLRAELSRERSVHALVLAGQGRGFCSGGDVDEIIGATLSMDTAQLLDFNRMTGQVVRAVRECPFPVIAAVHGVAAGAGAVLALARRLAGGPALAYAQTKALLTAELDMPLAAAIELDALTQALLMNGEDYAEFHAAFTEKRPPKWRGR